MSALEQKLLLACLPVTPDCDQLSHLIKQSPDWDALFSLGERHGVLPLIYTALNNLSENIVSPEILKPFRNWFAANALRSMQLQKELRCLVELLNGEGVSVIPYKGPILAEEVYGDLALRSFVDLDLLVPPKQAWDAVQILLRQSYALSFDLPQQRWSGLQKTDNHIALCHAERDWIVEIHWQLFHPMYVQPFDLSQHWRQLNCGMEGRFAREETLVMLCAHGTKHGWNQLKWLVDVDRLVRCGMINWEYALQLAKGSGSTRCLLLGLSLTNDLLETQLDSVVTKHIAKNLIVQTLADKVKANLFLSDSERKNFIDEYVFYLQSRDNMFDQLKQVLRWLFCPRLADWLVFKWGDYCHALYYVERPVRMFFKHVLRPMFVGTRKS